MNFISKNIFIVEVDFRGEGNNVLLKTRGIL